jgi:hypothetical protein
MHEKYTCYTTLGHDVRLRYRHPVLMLKYFSVMRFMLEKDLTSRRNGPATWYYVQRFNNCNL